MTAGILVVTWRVMYNGALHKLHASLIIIYRKIHDKEIKERK